MKIRKSTLFFILIIILPVIISVKYVESKPLATDICVSGDLAYILLVDEIGLYIVDINNPNYPRFVSYLKLDVYSATQIFVDNDYVYVSVQTEIGFSLRKYEVFIIDVSNPAEPIHIGSYEYNKLYFSNDLFVSNEVLYIVVNEKLQIINVSYPSNPTKIKDYLQCSIYGIYVIGNKVYITCGATGIKILDISTPSSPVFLGEYSAVEGYSLHVEGSSAFLHSTNVVSKLNVANPAAITFDGSFTVSSMTFCTVSDSTLYYLHSGFLYLIDFSTSTPLEISNLLLDQTYYKIYVKNDYVYLPSNSVTIIDASDPNNPTEISQIKITLPATRTRNIRNIILGIVALLILSSLVGVTIWRKDKIKERIERNRVQRSKAPPAKMHGYFIGRVNIPILILNIIVFAVAIFLILYAAITETCFAVLILFPLGLVLLICPITCIITTLIGKSRWVIYTKDEPTKHLSDVAQERQEGMVFCPSCGEQNNVEWKHCSKCGYDL